MLANAVVMQYVMMYSNDWLLTPIEAETGTVLNVEGIITTDTFGNKVFIDQSAEKSDNKKPEVPFIDRWSLFGTTLVNAYDVKDAKNNNFEPQGGLLFPPTVRRTEESKPIEEVQFLRDEMANMLWGVETTINDGCGGTMDGKGFSDTVLSVVDENKDNPEPHGEEYDYSFLLQNRVPINWIPFIPQHIEGERRDIVFRRGKMPVFYNGNYQPVRPSTELLKYSKHYLQNTLSSGSFSSGDTSSSKSNGSVFSRFPGGNLLSNDEYLIPRYINEEEIGGYGVKLVLTAQRTRWFLGDSFNWVGAKKVINQYQANSGLMFDDLIEKSNKVIKLE